MFQPDGAELFHFDDGFSSGNAYLFSFVTDSTWGDHVILHSAANHFGIFIDMINSPPRHYDVMTCNNRLVHDMRTSFKFREIISKLRLQTCGKPPLLKKLMSYNLTFRILQHIRQRCQLPISVLSRLECSQFPN